MSIVVTAPTGNIGSTVARNLLDQGLKPTLIARNPSKVNEFTDRGATVREGSHGDAAFLSEATKGAEALFVLTPPDMATTDIRGQYQKFSEASAQAIRDNDIPHVVHLSSVSAELESGNGPVAGLHVAEGVLAEAARNLIQLRPGYFMENTLGQVGAIQQASSLFTTFPPGTRFPMIATRDIGSRAADLLARRDWTGQQVVELRGPGETGYEEVAEILSEVLGREIKHVTLPGEQFVEILMGMGMSKEIADSLVELSEGMVTGRVRFLEEPGEKNATPTTYRQFAQEVFKPIFAAAGS